jgi:hypothetical protein
MREKRYKLILIIIIVNALSDIFYTELAHIINRKMHGVRGFL